MSRSKVVAFVGKAGFRYYVDDNTIELQYGKQNLEINKSNVYLLPFTSGQVPIATDDGLSTNCDNCGAYLITFEMIDYDEEKK